MSFHVRIACTVGLLLCLIFFSGQTRPAEPTNLLRNPDFRFYAFEKLRDAAADGDKSHTVAAWDADAWDDIEVIAGAAAKDCKPESPGDNVVRIRPGKHFRQFILLPEISVGYGDSLSLSVRGNQSAGQSLRAQIILVRVESEDGKWSPADLKLQDKRTFSKHGRGELIHQTLLEKTSPDAAGEFTLKLENAVVKGQVTQSRDSSKENTNAVAVIVDFENVATQDVRVYSPCLVKGPAAMAGLASSRPLPNFYRQIPHTMQKLWKGEPLHIITLGSSVDHGDANPHLYAYDEDPKSPTYKQPLLDSYLPSAAKVGHPELADYLVESQTWFVYSGRLRFDLMREFNLPINRILYNLTAAGGSSIGEAHAGYVEFGDLAIKPGEGSGHNPAKSWKELYPDVFARKEGPRPDLVIFGHGENEHVDGDQEPAVFEAAIRLFQRHYPGVECVFCIWPRDGKTVPFEPELKALAAHYNIPYIELREPVTGLYKTCDAYAICPDGGHPQAGMHDIWSKILGQAFQAAAPLETAIDQRQLPARLYPHAYEWEGDSVTYAAPAPRLVGSRMMLDDSAFILWIKNGGATKNATLFIDGKATDCGHGLTMTQRDSRNASFVYGLLPLGDRHIVEVSGEGAQIAAADCKVCLNKTFFDVASPAWTRKNAGKASDFVSEWGAPFGGKKLELQPGQSLEMEVAATDLAVAYVDRAEAGTLRVLVDGKEVLNQPANVPFVDSDKKSHFIENRKGIRGLAPGKHKIQIQAVDHNVSVLGLYTYTQ